MRVRVLLEPPKPRAPDSGALRGFRLFLLIAGLACIGYTGFVFFEAKLHERREEQVLNQPATPESPRSAPELTEGMLIGRIEIPRLDVHAVVEHGVEAETLRRAVGHVPGTALPGQSGNVALAGHRDTFFRGLRNVRKDDRIRIATHDKDYEYVVESTQIVMPSAVQILKPTPERELTLVTCYPFYFIGSAPKRFIVHARQVSVTPRELQGS